MDFNKGETIICSCEVKDSSGKFTAPESMKISIIHSKNGLEVNDKDMFPDETGKYHYDYSIPVIEGKYEITVRYKATDGGRITITEDVFQVR